MTHPLGTDLDHILEHTRELWDELRGERLFITGGTGFVGCWLLESFVWANERLKLKARAVVLTRNREFFKHKAPHLAGHPSIEFYQGDVKSFEPPPGSFSHVIHAAAETNATLSVNDPLLVLETITEGTRRTLETARLSGARKFLLVSSGAVYGKQPPDLPLMPEDYHGAPGTTEPQSSYGEGKRLAELLCTLYVTRYRLEAKLARCYAFVGPYLPLDAHYAIGNFIQDGMREGVIRVAGDGTPFRSYLYAADLAIWLWAILFRGKPAHPYNVGSAAAVTIARLAETVAQAFSPRCEVTFGMSRVEGRSPERYVPSTQRAQDELQVRQFIELGEAIKRTIAWHSIMKRQTHPVLLGTSPSPSRA